jgi:regulator of sigma E protease
MELFISFIAVVFVFGLIVFVHELGHMLAAKACGNAVPNFAIGMGPSLASFQRGGTRYHICMFPVGGFVTVSGLDSDDDPSIPEPQKWQSRNGWQKAFILVAGVGMNLVLAFVTVLVMGMAGFPQNVVRVAGVTPDAPGAVAGLKAGDFIMAVNDRRFMGSRQFTAIIQANQGRQVKLTVHRDGADITLSATPRVIKDYNNGRPSLGLALEEDLSSTTEISLVQPKSVGDQLRLQTGDRVVAIDGAAVVNGWDLLSALPLFSGENLEAIDAEGKPIPKGGGTPVTLVVERQTNKWPYKFNAAGIAVDSSGQPLKERGTVNGMPPKLLGAADGKSRVEFTLPGDTTAIALGVQFKPQLLRLPFGESVKRSMQDGAVMMVGMFYSMRLIFTEQGAKSISGPVGLVRMIGQSAKSDWYTFMQIILLINLNLALLNLLPLPALDGGRLVFVALAGIGLRVSEKREALVHAVGMVLLLSFIGIVTFTDVLALF